MKAALFEYVRPATLVEACALLAEDADARLIAGGQTLVPLLAMRLARPARLIDILRLPELAGIREEDGVVTVGATTRQAYGTRRLEGQIPGVFAASAMASSRSRRLV
jgi:CO/xanthine dehydrogenase FAD-binding subunit